MGNLSWATENFIFIGNMIFPISSRQNFCLVDLVNNISNLARDQDVIMKKVADKVATLNTKKMSRAITAYGNVRTKKLLQPLL